MKYMYDVLYLRVLLVFCYCVLFVLIVVVVVIVVVDDDDDDDDDFVCSDRHLSR